MRGPKYEYDHNNGKQRNAAVQETSRVGNGWQEGLDVIYCASGKQRPKTLYGFVIIIGIPKSYRSEC
jgi:hypothetical protein